MVTEGGRTMTFFAFAREIRNLIYVLLAPKDKSYIIISADAVAILEALFNSEPDLGITNVS